MKRLASIVLLLCGWLATGQSREQDSLELIKTTDWLERKLSSTYYNPDDHEWWINDFTYNPKTKVVLIKNTATDRLGKPGGKTYLQRSFRLDDMNAFTISTEPIDKNAGRMVVGSSIRLGVYKHARKVDQSKNGLAASPQSSVYFSVPKSADDSVKGFSQQIADQLKKAVLLSTRLYPATTPPAQLIMLMEDHFVSETRKWETSRIFENTLEIDEWMGETRTRKLLLRFDGSRVFLTRILPTGTSQEVELRVDSSEVGFSGSGFRLTFENKNELSVEDETGSYRLMRAWGFDADPQYR